MSMHWHVEQEPGGGLVRSEFRFGYEELRIRTPSGRATEDVISPGTAEVATFFERKVGRDQHAAALPSLDDHRRRREPGDDAVPGWKAPLGSVSRFAGCFDALTPHRDHTRRPRTDKTALLW
jgi:hypothetical protein